MMLQTFVFVAPYRVANNVALSVLLLPFCIAAFSPGASSDQSSVGRWPRLRPVLCGSLPAIVPSVTLRWAPRHPWETRLKFPNFCSPFSSSTFPPRLGWFMRKRSHYLQFPSGGKLNIVSARSHFRVVQYDRRNTSLHALTS